jgi:hypothetical protein
VRVLVVNSGPWRSNNKKDPRKPEQFRTKIALILGAMSQMKATST